MNSSQITANSTGETFLTPRLPAHSQALPNGETLIMGVLNLTPDSFSDGGRYTDRDNALRHAEYLRENGAHIIDVGGESTRPGSQRISAEQELERIETIVTDLVKRDYVVSVDTVHATTAQRVADLGAHIINDISGAQFDPQMPAVMAACEAAVVIQHWRGFPGQANEHYDPNRPVIDTISEELHRQVQTVIEAGVDCQRIIIDPGLGFGKDVPTSWATLAGLTTLQERCTWPILVGASRKRMLREITERHDQLHLDAITAGITGICAQNRVWAVRVHEPITNTGVLLAVKTWQHATM